MSYIDKTMFEYKASERWNTQATVAGYFGAVSGTWAGADCSAGILCVKHSLADSEGYSSIPNGNTWKFVAASTGLVATHPMGDSTGIYAFDNSDVAKAVSTDGTNIYNIGYNTLGLGLPAGVRGSFREIRIGDQYVFGEGNFTENNQPTNTKLYVTITTGGQMTSTDSYSAASTNSLHVYFKFLRSIDINEGTTYWGKGYVLEACRMTYTPAG